MSAFESQVIETAIPPDQARSGHARKIVQFVTKTNQYSGAERHLLELLRRVHEPGVQLSILCLGDDVFSQRLDSDRSVHVKTHRQVPSSLWDWVRLFSAPQPD